MDGLATIINPVKAELNSTCHLLALLGTHHIFHVSGLRVKSLAGVNDPASVQSVDQTSAIYMFQFIVTFLDECQLY